MDKSKIINKGDLVEIKFSWERPEKKGVIGRIIAMCDASLTDETVPSVKAVRYGWYLGLPQIDSAPLPSHALIGTDIRVLIEVDTNLSHPKLRSGIDYLEYRGIKIKGAGIKSVRPYTDPNEPETNAEKPAEDEKPKNIIRFDKDEFLKAVKEF